MDQSSSKAADESEPHDPTASGPAPRFRGPCNAWASNIVVGNPDADTLINSTQVPALHAAGIVGYTQVIGIGDTGVDAAHCSFKDTVNQVPYDSISAKHRKIAAYFTLNGDQSDGAVGHGTHVAASIVGAVPGAGRQGQGMAPAARVAVVDLEKSSAPGKYNVPVGKMGPAYFDLMKGAGAYISCSPWSFDRNQALDFEIDTWVSQNPDSLPIFPSGNVFGQLQSASYAPQSPCTAKNVLCVGASYNAKTSFMAAPSFTNIAIQLGNFTCKGSSRVLCADEVQAWPALFGPTAPSSNATCSAVAPDCMSSGSACGDCAFPSSVLGGVSDTAAMMATPNDGCSPLIGFIRGFICVTKRGNCPFSQKALFCQAAGAVAAVVIDGAGQSPAVMVANAAASTQIQIPVLLAPDGSGDALLAAGRLLTLPMISKRVHPFGRAPFSAYGTLPDGRIKPEIVVPGDNIESAFASSSCSWRRLSGTSQACGVAAGVAALARDYLQGALSAANAKQIQPWASTIKAMMVAAARRNKLINDDGIPFAPEVGFGLSVLSTLVLPLKTGTIGDLAVVQSKVDSASPQTFCMAVRSLGLTSNSTNAAELASVAADIAAAQVTTPQAVLAWTDPPHPQGLLVNNLDLSVRCDWWAWSPRLGNGGASPDTANNVEKVLLNGLRQPNSTNGMCLFTVAAPNVSSRAGQLFSLVMRGPFWHSRSCDTAAAHPFCANGEAALMNASQTWGCKCRWPWLGPFCDQVAEPVALGPTPLVRSVRPWQWIFFQVNVSCGSGYYEFALQETQTSGLVTLFGATDYPAFGMPPQSNAEILKMQASIESLGYDYSWGLSSSSSGSQVVRLDTRHVPSNVSKSARILYLGVYGDGRDGSVPFQVRWQQLPGSGACSIAPGTDAGRSVPLTAGQIALFFVLGLLAIIVPIGLFFIGRCLLFRYKGGKGSGWCCCARKGEPVLAQTKPAPEPDIESAPQPPEMPAASSTSFVDLLAEKMPSEPTPMRAEEPAATAQEAASPKKGLSSSQLLELQGKLDKIRAVLDLPSSPLASLGKPTMFGNSPHAMGQQVHPDIPD